MRELIDDLLEYSRADMVNRSFVPVDMNTVVKNTLAILKVPIEEAKAEIDYRSPTHDHSRRVTDGAADAESDRQCHQVPRDRSR